MINEVYRSVLKMLVLELAVDEFSSPDGLSASLIKVSNQFGHGVSQERITSLLSIENQPHNGTVQRLPTPAKRRKSGDPWSMYDWQNEILSFATAHNGIFDCEQYREEKFDQATHADLSFSNTKVFPTLQYMVKGNKTLVNVRKGVYRITAKGRRQETIPEESPSTVPAAAIQRTDKEGAVADAVIEFAHQHSGRFSLTEVTTVLRQRFPEKNPNKIGAAIGALVRNKRIRKVGPKTYELTKQATPKPRRTGLPQGQNRAILPGQPIRKHILEFTRQHGNRWVGQEYKPVFEAKYGKSYNASNGSIYGAIAMLVREGSFRKTGTGTYDLIEDKAAAQNA